MSRTSRGPIWVVAGLALLSSCGPAVDSTAPLGPPIVRLAASTSSAVTAIDISNGIAGGGGFAIAASGLIVGDRGGANRGWWQSPSPSFTPIDSGYVYGGNSFADVGDGARVLLSNNGAPPFTSVTLQLLSGVNPRAVVVRDINDSRVIVASLGTVYGLRWDSPTSTPTELLPGTPGYPIQQVIPYSISSTGLIAGRLVVTVRKNTTKSVPVIWTGSNTATELPLPAGAVDGLASNVNAAGVVSGFWNDGRVSAPIRWTPRTGGGYDIAVLNLDVGGTNLSTGIDECGRITGGSPQGAWVWDPTAGLTILSGIGGSGVPGWSYSINANGQLVGSSYDGTGRNAVYHATLWTGLPACTTP